METLDSTLYLSNDDLFLLARGEWYKSYEKLGAHPAKDDSGTSGFHFAVWAPDVKSVHVIGDFNGWDETANPLVPTQTGGVWQGFVPGVGHEALYKYLIETMDGRKLYKADPYGFYAEQIPGTASRTFDLAGYKWGDGTYMKNRAKRDMFKEPLNIFEVHLGSWRRHGDEPQGEPRPDGTYPGPGDPFPAQRGVVYSYDDLSVELVAYAKEMGYSHLEIMPVNEHPFDGSWGYQPTGYYAATSRYGNPKQFMHFVDACHKAGIGVILDWVPGGFCADAQGLATFNGQMLYEHKIHPNWSTHQFDYSRGEVRSFLVSNALFWAEYFHADGLRMDGVSSMLYMNFGIDDPGQKRFNEKGTEEDLDASAFIRQTNTAMGKFHPDVMMIAEESTAWPLVTYPPEDGGLGFHFKWDMGWMNDTLHYLQTDFPWRPGNYRMLTFSSMYQFNENFILPLSHDEVVNGKCSLITRQPGDFWRQFAGMRALAFYQMTHPGGKLNFMGNEIAQFIEWRYYEGIQYFLAEQYDTHRHHQQFIRDLNAFYNKNKALWQRAFSSEGFEWIDADNAEQSIISFIRRGEKPGDELVVLINFDVNARENFRMGVPEWGVWEEQFNSDDERYGGSGVVNVGKIKCQDEPWNGREQSIVVRVPPLGGMILKRTGTLRRPAKKKPAGTTAKKATAAEGEKPKATTAKPAAKKVPAKSSVRSASAQKPVAKKKTSAE
ncbi:1,4-alpha-glucan branching protein GlgB [Olsenella sp. An290]|uniref:1,4-alpha-glucan branching protein GlgB n=1 Tax=Olsenella sp. An290 TaxID=1965625 RepID=UPI000B3ADF0E|nr:1,4-alpha-glucan branching protein GlgB [Olsenella sp. An290]OUO35744.1 1,4-alpha-glucan branching enzyme [Olsenella sp. An290]